MIRMRQVNIYVPRRLVNRVPSIALRQSGLKWYRLASSSRSRHLCEDRINSWEQSTESSNAFFSRSTYFVIANIGDKTHRQIRQSNMLKQGQEILLTKGLIVFDPGEDTIVNDLLVGNLEESDWIQRHSFSDEESPRFHPIEWDLPLHWLSRWEIPRCEPRRRNVSRWTIKLNSTMRNERRETHSSSTCLFQLRTVVEISKTINAETIGRFEMTSEEKSALTLNIYQRKRTLRWSPRRSSSRTCGIQLK